MKERHVTMRKGNVLTFSANDLQAFGDLAQSFYPCDSRNTPPIFVIVADTDLLTVVSPLLLCVVVFNLVWNLTTFFSIDLERFD